LRAAVPVEMLSLMAIVSSRLMHGAAQGSATVGRI
jgi:hypothetical protein